MKKLLCIFTFLILNHAAYAVEDVSLQYKLLAGDRVAISVWGEDTLNLKDIMVLPDGTISFPLAGNFQVVGYTSQQWIRPYKTVPALFTRLIKFPSVSF